MPYLHYTEELLDLKDIIVSKVERKENIMHIYLKMEQRIHACPDLNAISMSRILKREKITLKTGSVETAPPARAWDAP